SGELPMVFERFHRARSVGRTGGSGLGLSIAKRIADLHYADLSLLNRPEGGLGAHIEIKTF
ncbi:MAG: sensor histidine kinase, partial [Bdellovibrionales bacterium]|nr:sensor histidine kinase [Bdellovibrionales bacterium]